MRLVLSILVLGLIGTLSLFAGEVSHSCAKGAHEGRADHSCEATCHHEHESAEQVELTGKLLCRHCNLHETKSCEKVFVTADDQRYLLCPHSDLDELERLSEHGSATIVVAGTIIETGEDTPLLMAESARPADE